MKTDNLKFSSVKKSIIYCGEKADIYVNIRLNDECKNGHQDFAITADIYKAGYKSDRSFLAGGCCHEEILKYFPEFKIFIDLHLCDFNGVPMHPTANMSYHMKTDNMTKAKFCKYYGITSEEFDLLKTYEDSQTLFYIGLVEKTNILDRWQAKAKKAIVLLESLTNEEFLNNSKRSQLSKPEQKDINEEKEKLKTGYYSKDEKIKRKNKKFQEEKQRAIDSAKADFNKESLKAKIKLDIALKFARIDYKFDNWIYYSHSNTICLNWKGYEKNLTDKEIKTYIKKFDTIIKKYGVNFEKEENNKRIKL